MYKITESILFAFSAILNYKVIKRALVIGLGVSLVWIGIGYVIWGDLISITAHIIDLVPFAMLRSNGVFVLSTFLWFSLVLVTFALILAFFGNIILDKVSKEKYSAFSLLIVLGSAIFWSIIWFLKGHYIHIQLTKLLNWFPFETLKEGLAYLLGLYILYSALIVTMLLVTSFFSEGLLKDIKTRYFPNEELLNENEVKATENRVVDIAIYIAISIVAFPLLFIPVVNFVVQLALWIWLIKDTFVKDSEWLLVPKDKRDKLSKYRLSFFIISAFAALFNFLPVFNIFGPFFGEIAMFDYLRKIRNEL